MSKYIPSDKLIAEIERQKRENLGSPECVCDDILSSIASLQQEQPEVDLEKEINDWFNTMGIPATVDALKETARHFYELGRYNARKED